ncbi:hypothetical protein [Arcticibacterium luteifluviistationis]|uniref:Lipoprotein n=1 Tax=Arcticibacterium luteifluviistationis TaxID=1784714 RepID=A0A2Z4GAT7_9BACT|nr:hypothetical protein [Arcticibacterium luteifluviistationis]AWV98336.1 hypothetical protein DJ013_09195 [Arcticibacterium luteifluviistationis]
MNNKLLFPYLLFASLLFCSCESSKEREAREFAEEQHLIEQAEKKALEEKVLAQRKREAQREREKRLEQERIEREAILEKERQERAIYDRYINNSLKTGSMPYAKYFGSNNSCHDSYGCSQISVQTPSNSDVIVTIKKDGQVFRHAYIEANSNFTFNMPNGTYQPFFYYGTGWNPKKIVKETVYETLQGGFISSEHFGKDSPQFLSSNVLSYELVLQQNGNFSSKPSSSEEAF